MTIFVLPKSIQMTNDIFSMFSSRTQNSGIPVCDLTFQSNPRGLCLAHGRESAYNHLDDHIMIRRNMII